MQHSAERRYEKDGAVYVIRDVFNSDGSFSRCEYATSVGVWIACCEGVSFNEIQPFAHAAPVKRNWVV